MPPPKASRSLDHGDQKPSFDLHQVDRFTLTRGEVELSVIAWGATITSLKWGILLLLLLLLPHPRVGGEDVVLGFSDMAGYTSAAGRGKNPYMGAVVGRWWLGSGGGGVNYCHNAVLMVDVV